MRKYFLKLRAFDGDGAGDGGAGDAAGITSGNAEIAGSSEETLATSDTSFEDYMKAHSDEASKWFQDRFDKRHKDYKQLQSRVKASDSIMDMLAVKFGIEDRNDINAITEALQNDDFLYAERAEENNRSIEEQRNWDRMERENRMYREAQREAQQRQAAERQFNEWTDQSNNLKAVFPSFDLDAELANPDFANMLWNGMSMERAFYAIHGAEIASGAMQYTAQAVRQATADDLAARRTRPRENGLSGQAAAKVGKDVSKLTKAERAEMARRSLRSPIHL